LCKFHAGFEPFLAEKAHGYCVLRMKNYVTYGFLLGLKRARCHIPRRAQCENKNV
jgi:hypothetical protein